MPHLDQKAQYVIKTAGCIDAPLIDWFGPIEIASVVETSGEALTTLSGIVADQAGLVGLVRHLHGLGLVILSIERVPFAEKGKTTIDGSSS